MPPKEKPRLEAASSLPTQASTTKGGHTTARDDGSSIVVDDISCTLHAAAKAGDIVRCTSLLAGDPTTNVNGLDEEGITPLYYAAVEGHAAICAHLLAGGAAVDGLSTVSRRFLLTALFGAAIAGHTETCRVLLDAGAAVDHVETLEGYTPLLWSARRGHVATYALLLERGANVNHVNHDGLTAILRAADGGHLDAFRHIADCGGNLLHVDQYGRTPLHIAAIGGHLEVCRYLVDKGAQIDGKRDSSGDTALISAAEFGQLEVCAFLLDSGSAKHAVSWCLYTALLAAAEQGELEVCRYLVSRGARVQSRTTNKNTVLTLAATGGCVDTCKCFLEECGADIEHQNNGGFTAFMCAAQCGHVDVCEYLHRFQSATEQRKRCSNALFSAAKGGHAALCASMIENYGIDVNIEDSSGVTPLIIAVREGRVDACHCLLDHGADFNSMSCPQMAPLLVASCSGKEKVSLLLMQFSSSQSIGFSC